jgi:hypothetical protein
MFAEGYQDSNWDLKPDASAVLTQKVRHTQDPSAESTGRSWQGLLSRGAPENRPLEGLHSLFSARQILHLQVHLFYLSSRVVRLFACAGAITGTPG